MKSRKNRLRSPSAILIKMYSSDKNQIKTRIQNDKKAK